MSLVKRINSLEEIPHREAICITGGEPLEHPKVLTSVIDQAKILGFRTIYLYSARYTPRFEEFVNRVDGVHFTLHEATSARDVADFAKVQEIALRHPDKSFRAYLFPGIKHEIKVIPNAWKRVEVKPWIPESEMCLPANEEIFSLQCEYQG